MAPQCSNATDIYVAAKEISSSLSHLRREHGDTKNVISTLFDQILIQQRHMNRIDELIDQHQAKIDGLLNIVTQPLPNDNDLQLDLNQPPVSAAHLPLQVPVSNWSTTDPAATSPLLVDHAACSDREWAVDLHSGDIMPANAGEIDDQTNCNNVATSSDANVVVKAEVLPIDQPVVTSKLLTVPGPDQDPVTTSVVDALDYQAHASTSSGVKPKPRKRTKLSTNAHLPNRTGLQHKRPLNQNSTQQPATTTTTALPKWSAQNAEAHRGVNFRGRTMYRCCNIAFLSKSDWSRHVMGRHTSERPFKCRFCTYASVRRADLIRHEKTHRQS